MLISIIAAMDEERGIGYQNRIPWHLPDELKHFKRVTYGHHLIMGRKTYQSLGSPLPGRTSIVMTRNKTYQPAENGLVIIAHSLEEALEIARKRDENEVFISGGETIYSESLRYARKMILTTVHTVVQADTYFPHYESGSWNLVRSLHHPRDEQHRYAFTIKTYQKEVLDNNQSRA